MKMIIKSSLCPVQDNSLTPEEVNKGCKSEQRGVEDSVNNSALNRELSEVKNGDKKFTPSLEKAREMPTSGIFAKDFRGAGALLSDERVLPTDCPSQVNGHLRINNIVTALLPKFDCSYQIARTSYENVDMCDALASESAKQSLLKASTEKQNLQKEAITLFIQQFPDTGDALQYDAVVSPGKDSVYPLFSFVFSLSYSYQDVEYLLDFVGLKNSFINFANNIQNHDQVNDLYQALNTNSANSLAKEMIHYTNNDQ
ncbi:hypothetical protein [Lelliottia sp. WAP21]|uniref:hypothetical protein n=1 Tax=Lelliottia sp. WAP21 TaxID=2877426 RepID=UPI001E481DC7|nr:hypothetical protein [Lelliottia sp. WAP21]